MTAQDGVGPVEQTLEEGIWTDEPEKRHRALVLDLAGATQADVDEAFRALDSVARVRAEWSYFLTVITRRVAEREIARREVAGRGR